MAASPEPSNRLLTIALALSREKYCSVWNSLRPDIELRTSYTIERPEPEPRSTD